MAKQTAKSFVTSNVAIKKYFITIGYYLAYSIIRLHDCFRFL